MNPLTGLFQTFCLDFEWLLPNFGIPWTPYSDISRSEAAIRNLGKILIQSVIVCLNFQNTYFREHLLIAAFMLFWSTCFSEHLKVDALFIKQPSYFFLGIFLVKESPKKSGTFTITSTIKKNSIIAFHHVFIITFYVVTLQELSITEET